MKMRNVIVQRYPVYIIGIILLILLSGGSAYGQLIIQPMRLDLNPSPGETLRTSFDLQNHDPNTHIVDLELVDLAQWEDSSWRIIEPNDDFDRSKLSSCKDWITFEAKRYEVRPLRIIPINLSLKVPPRTRGFYAAGIIASLSRTQGNVPIAINVRFLVPVLVNIRRGRTIRHDVEMTDLGMRFREPSGLKPATTMITLDVVNNGETFSSLRAFGKVRGFSNGHWQQIATTEFRETGIIPGSNLKLQSDIGVSLPSGLYQVTTGLYVDGRRTKAIRKELDFTGDPAVDKMVSQVALTVMEPAAGIVTIESSPGATRTDVIKLRNDSDDTINVETSLAIPPGLHGAVFGDFNGDDLDCSGWLKIMPESFTLRRGGRQNIQVTAKMPNLPNMQPWYYSLLSMTATYPDNQGAGKKHIYVCVGNQMREATPVAMPAKLDIITMEGANNLIYATFGNYGYSHFSPRCNAVVTRPSTGHKMATVLLTNDETRPMLPLESRAFSGAVDFTDYEPDIYYVTANMEYAPGQVATKQIPVKVSLRGNEKIVESIQPERTGPVPIDLNR